MYCGQDADTDDGGANVTTEAADVSATTKDGKFTVIWTPHAGAALFFTCSRSCLERAIPVPPKEMDNFRVKSTYFTLVCTCIVPIFVPLKQTPSNKRDNNVVMYFSTL